jgi:hypothetical protein
MHQDVYPALVQLIINLRQCRSYKDYAHFQEDLLTRVLEVQAHRNACRQNARRLRADRKLLPTAPELRSGLPSEDPESWELEVDVCERVDRQLRSIADALAWRAFNYDRQVIIALSRNQPAGPMAGKDGLPAEREFVAEWSKDESSFVLLHDLTSCLRIGDAALFKSVGNEYEAYLYEIKTDPERRKSTQLRRKRLAEEAIRDGGPLPDDSDGRLVPLITPYKTHLSMLRNAFDLARRDGVRGMRVPGGMALVAADMRRGYERWSEAEFLARTGVEHRGAMKRTGILNVGNHVFYASNDYAARSPIMPPWAIYPLPPLDCANLIVDMAVYIVTVSSESLLGALRRVGLAAEWTLPVGQAELEAGQVILRIHNGKHSIEMRPSEMQRLLLELVDLPTWAEGIRELLDHAKNGIRPWPNFADERKIWA